MAMLNAATATAAAAAARNQQQFPPSPGTTAAASSSTPPTTSSTIQTTVSPNSQLQHQLQLGLQTLTQDGIVKPEVLTAAQVSSFSPLTVGALLKMNNSGVTDDGASGIGTASILGGIKNGGQSLLSSLSTTQTMAAALSGTPSPSPPSSAPLISHHLQQEGAKFGSPSPHHSPNPNPHHHHAGGQVIPASVVSSKSSRPAPIQITPGVNRLVDDTSGSGVPATPASPFTGQQGGYAATIMMSYSTSKAVK